MKFKGKSFIAIVLSPEPPYEAWFQEIDRIIARTPGFFIDRPIVLDVRGTKIPIEDLEKLLAGLVERSVRVMGIDGVAGTRLKPGMPPSFGGGRLTADVEIPQTSAETDAGPASADGNGRPSSSGEAADGSPEKSGKGKAGGGETEAEGGKSVSRPATVDALAGHTDPASDNSIVITEPVRSGQSIMHPEGDVTIVGSVSSGAEVIAGGSIHIYGALRGRALAGVAGKGSARIFCSKLDAELVSINGLYKIAEDFDNTLLNAPAQIRFENETLVFEQLT